MGVGERDPHTGHMTTGHEWNGIKELNTPVPRPVYFFLAATALFGIVYWILMPAWPIGVTYTKGLLGVDQRATVAQSLKQAQLDRSVWTKRIESETFNAVQSDPQLMTIVRQTGHALFGDNCAACHGANARGGKGFPNLTTAVVAVGRELQKRLQKRYGSGSIRPTPIAGPRRCLHSGTIRYCRAPTSRMSSVMCEASPTVLRRTQHKPTR